MHYYRDLADFTDHMPEALAHLRALSGKQMVARAQHLEKKMAEDSARRATWTDKDQAAFYNLEFQHLLCNAVIMMTAMDYVDHQRMALRN